MYLLYLFPYLMRFFITFRSLKGREFTRYNWFILIFVGFQYSLVIIHTFVSLIDSAMKLVIRDFWLSPEYETYEKPFYTLNTLKKH